MRQDGLGDDVQLALYLAYESHFSTLPGVVADLEWDPALIAFRRSLERAFEDALRQAMPSWADRTPVSRAIPEILQLDDGPSLSAHMERDGTLEEMRELVVHRSAYQLKEGDGHTFAIPRLHGRAKQLLVEIQAGEYGADAPGRTMHSTLFAQTMRHLGLDDRLHAYLDVLPASALAVSNLISMFGLNRRWRGALVGHLAVFEMTSVTPMGRYTRALERLGCVGRGPSLLRRPRPRRRRARADGAGHGHRDGGRGTAAAAGHHLRRPLRRRGRPTLRRHPLRRLAPSRILDGDAPTA